MSDADSIWKSKLSRLQDPNLEKMNLLWSLWERRQERGEPRPDASGAQKDTQGPWWRRALGR